MITCQRYTADQLKVWNELVDKSRNGLFLFMREYMDYHADRFKDHSLLLLNDGNPVALFPANESDKIIHSHQGLTFGGLLTLPGTSVVETVEMFAAVKEYYLSLKFETLIYKAIPHIYHTEPSEDDKYALFRNHAVYCRVDITSTVDQRSRVEFQERRRRSIKKAKANNTIIRKAKDENEWKQYWDFLTKNLELKFNAKPVHSCAEILLLQKRFPENIHLFLAVNEQTSLQAGVVIYESKNVAHVQYSSLDPDQPNSGGLDLIYDHLLNEAYVQKKYFDFGTSTDNQGHFLNKGLVEFKEGFGARSVVHEFFEVKL